MNSKENISKVFDEVSSRIKAKYLDSNADLYDLEELIFSEMQDVQKKMMGDLHAQKIENVKKKAVLTAN